jgi:hypothetical protein
MTNPGIAFPVIVSALTILGLLAAWAYSHVSDIIRRAKHGVHEFEVIAVYRGKEAIALFEGSKT